MSPVERRPDLPAPVALFIDGQRIATLSLDGFPSDMALRMAFRAASALAKPLSRRVTVRTERELATAFEHTDYVVWPSDYPDTCAESVMSGEGRYAGA